MSALIAFLTSPAGIAVAGLVLSHLMTLLHALGYKLPLVSALIDAVLAALTPAPAPAPTPTPGPTPTPIPAPADPLAALLVLLQHVGGGGTLGVAEQALLAALQAALAAKK